jgi:hypothetical protein
MLISRISRSLEAAEGIIGPGLDLHPADRWLKMNDFQRLYENGWNGWRRMIENLAITTTTITQGIISDTVDKECFRDT